MTWHRRLVETIRFRLTRCESQDKYPHETHCLRHYCLLVRRHDKGRTTKARLSALARQTSRINSSDSWSSHSTTWHHPVPPHRGRRFRSRNHLRAERGRL